jgi:hypothetical protein
LYARLVLSVSRVSFERDFVDYLYESESCSVASS